jgi:RNA polymerase sigma-70 factor (ECF subfamily)
VPARSVELGSLFGCVDALDERGRTVLMLSFVEECSADEIGSRLALSAGNVRVLRHRALLSVRRCLGWGSE